MRNRCKTEVLPPLGVSDPLLHGALASLARPGVKRTEEVHSREHTPCGYTAPSKSVLVHRWAGVLVVIYCHDGAS